MKYRFVVRMRNTCHHTCPRSPGRFLFLEIWFPVEEWLRLHEFIYVKTAPFTWIHVCKNDSAGPFVYQPYLRDFPHSSWDFITKPDKRFAFAPDFLYFSYWNSGIVGEIRPSRQSVGCINRFFPCKTMSLCVVQRVLIINISRITNDDFCINKWWML